MPPHLHPRSTATSTLFAGTLLASFVIVSIPHLFPCPRPRNGQYESDNRLRKPNPQIPQPKETHSQGGASPQSPNTSSRDAEEAMLFRELEAEARLLEKQAEVRECPVPKPRGVLGRVLGFNPGTK